MAKVRVEFVYVGAFASNNAVELALVRQVISSSVLTSSGTATSGGTRPVAPSFAGDQGFVTIAPVDGNVCVAFGSDVVATQANSKLVFAGQSETFPITAGHVVSIIDPVL